VASRDAVSHYRVLETFGDDYSLVEVKLETGRTHQIRVHMRHINHPVVGDPVYGSGRGKRDLGLSRQFLHAYKLELSHPRTKEPLSFEESIPPELQLILNELRGMYIKRILR
jgi:23S rRNA pseudouridine1911/1915/1917 synthase